ncbi:MAG: SdrD B-like domain-containing protein [Planctomycetia bacterium]|nr:SdrD B-like domain-containing protein [Planctomycetia bacterium]
MSRKTRISSSYRRLNGVELLENRCLLSASPIEVGAVYYEGAPTEVGSGVDTASDYLYVSFQGGAEGTELTQITIDLARYGQEGRYSFIDQGTGAYGSTDFKILESEAYSVTNYLISEDGTLLTINLEGFSAGDILVVEWDVDEVLNADGDLDAEVTGAEFSATAQISATFSADHYEDALVDDVAFKDRFEEYYPGYDISGLPNDDFTNEPSIPPGDGEPQPVYTAGAFATAAQVPLPCTISGTVYEDANYNFEFDSGDKLLEGVVVDLWQLNDSGEYVKVDSTLTDENGEYSFDVQPGTYRVIETTPDGYKDVTSFVGTIDGVPVGTQIDANTLTDIVIEGGEDSIKNDFSEYRPALISGHVYHDANNNGVLDEGEEAISNVPITLKNLDTGETFTVFTDEFGYWEFDDLTPGKYCVSEVTPEGFADGKDTIGTLGGVQVLSGAEEDKICSIVVASGNMGLNYDFGELYYSSIAGKVWVDSNQNGEWEVGEKLLSNVKIELRDENGNVLKTTYTDDDGEYEFVELLPGTYSVYEYQPEAYLNGGQAVGSEGGEIASQDLTIGIDIASGEHGINYDFWEYEYAEISGYVFQDGDELKLPEGSKLPDNIWELYPGERNESSTPLSGVTLILADENGNPILDENGNEITTVTDENGYYCFQKLSPGVYTILEEQPAAYTDGIDTPGSLGGSALAPTGDKLSNIEVSYGDKGVEYNFSEILVIWSTTPPDPPGGPPTIEGPPGRPNLGGGGSAPVTPNSYMPYFGSSHGLSLGGGMGMSTNAWHLSVINGGVARDGGNTLSSYIANASFDPNSWQGRAMNRIRWMLAENANNPEGAYFGIEGAKALTGDFNGDGVDELAIFLDGFWFIDLNGNMVWDDYDLWVHLGEPGDQPVVGDWDGDGKADIGVFGRARKGDEELLAKELGLPDAENQRRGQFKNMPTEKTAAAYRYMKASKNGLVHRDVVDHVFQFGQDGDIAIAGDWNGDGIWSVGIFNDGKWTLDVDGDGRFTSADKTFQFGEKGDIPVVGKWDGGEVSKIGVYRDGKWILDVAGAGVMDDSVRVVHRGGPGEQPIVGDFDGSGVSELATYRDVSGRPEANVADAPGGDVF